MSPSGSCGGRVSVSAREGVDASDCEGEPASFPGRGKNRSLDEHISPEQVVERLPAPLPGLPPHLHPPPRVHPPTVFLSNSVALS